MKMLLLLALSKTVTGKSQFKKPHFSPFMLYVKNGRQQKMSCVEVEIFLLNQDLFVLSQTLIEPEPDFDILF